MKWLRLTIAQVMLAVLYAAIGFSAFRTAGDALYGENLSVQSRATERELPRSIGHHRSR